LGWNKTYKGKKREEYGERELAITVAVATIAIGIVVDNNLTARCAAFSVELVCVPSSSNEAAALGSSQSRPSYLE
jgi:hypothetical protein